jgi:hypothetical protein
MPAQHVPVVPRAPQDMELCKLQREQEGEVPSTILQLLAHRAAQRREAFAYLLLGRDGGELARLSYGELQRRAEAVAAGLCSPRRWNSSPACSGCSAWARSPCRHRRRMPAG